MTTQGPRAVHELDWLSERFESHRGHLRSVARRILGSTAEAEDAVQGAWLRLSHADPDGIHNLVGWLTTAVAREALDMLRARNARLEHPLDTHLPDPVVTRVDSDPENAAVLADSVGLALQMVLDSLSPSQRVAFVLHDVFAVPFDEIAGIVERSPEATRQLASRARRRVQDAPEPGVEAQRSIVDAFFSAARDGDFEALVAVLDPDLVLRVDGGKGALAQVVGAEAVARQAMLFADPQKLTHQVLVNDRPGVVVTDSDLNPLSVMTFTVSAGKIVAIDSLIDVDRLRVLDLPSLD